MVEQERHWYQEEYVKNAARSDELIRFWAQTGRMVYALAEQDPDNPVHQRHLEILESFADQRLLELKQSRLRQR